MAKQVTVRTDKDHRDALEAMQQDNQADSMAEAIRQTSRNDLARRGFLNKSSHDTTLRKATNTLAQWFTIAGLVLVGVTWWYPVEFRVLVVAPIISGLFLFGVERLLADVEPDVTLRLKRLFGGETA